MQNTVVPLQPTWQQALSSAITNPAELLQILELDPKLFSAASTKDFPLRVPLSFVARMQKGNIHDPLLQQVLPIDQELNIYSGFSTDPLGERFTNPLSGILHKYQGRVLLVTTGACAVNCRYCFRRHFAYDDNNPGTAGWQKAIDYIAQDTTIKEVILSGGDPLITSDRRLQALAKQLEDIPHLTTLRIHTRMPIVLPERITADFTAWFSSLRLKPVLVTHCNHPQEIDASVAAAIQHLRTAGITVFNQSVLLKNINDSAQTLIDLSERLFEIGIIPYYLHLLDKVQGAAHFDVEKEQAKALIAEIVKQLPGYLVPKLVWEQAGAASKLAL